MFVKTLFAKLLLNIIPKTLVSRFVGWLSRLQLPKPILSRLITLYSKLYKVDLEESKKPVLEFSTFNEFFIRHLKPGARPIDQNEKAIISPVDGYILEYGKVSDGTLIQAKGINYTLGSLVIDPELKKQLEGSAYITIYLDPSCYHRIHMPFNGSVSKAIHVPGAKYPAFGLSVTSINNLFCRNERLITVINSTFGILTMIKVAALNVGNIRVTYDEKIGKNPPVPPFEEIRYPHQIDITKGEEIGRFEMGSTVILLFEKDKIQLDNFQPQQKVKMGESIGTIHP